MNATYPDSTLPPFVIVDDSDDDVFLLRHRLRDGGITNPIFAFDSVSSGLDFVRSRSGPNELPAVVFTDIRMSSGSGFALISTLRANPEWDSIRIVVLSSSSRMLDLERAVECGANGYLVKFPPSATLADFLRNGPWIPLRGSAHNLTHPHATKHDESCEATVDAAAPREN